MSPRYRRRRPGTRSIAPRGRPSPCRRDRTPSRSASGRRRRRQTTRRCRPRPRRPHRQCRPRAARARAARCTVRAAAARGALVAGTTGAEPVDDAPEEEDADLARALAASRADMTLDTSRDEALARSLAESPAAPEASRDAAAAADTSRDEALARALAQDDAPPPAAPEDAALARGWPTRPGAPARGSIRGRGGGVEPSAGVGAARAEEECAFGCFKKTVC